MAALAVSLALPLPLHPSEWRVEVKSWSPVTGELVVHDPRHNADWRLLAKMSAEYRSELLVTKRTRMRVDRHAKTAYVEMRLGELRVLVLFDVTRITLK